MREFILTTIKTFAVLLCFSLYPSIPVLATTSASPFNTITRQRISINDGWLFYFILQTFRIDP